MKGYVVKNQDGSVTKGWVLRQGFSVRSAMCRLSLTSAQEQVEEVPVELAVRSASRDSFVTTAGEAPASIEALKR